MRAKSQQVIRLKSPHQRAPTYQVASQGAAYRPQTLALLFHCRPAFLQPALVKGCGMAT